MVRILIILGLLCMLFQTGSVQAANTSSGCETGAAASVCPEKPCVGAASAIPAVPLDKYMKDKTFKPGDIEQVVPVPSTKAVDTCGVSSISAVPLKDYVKDNDFRPNKVKQYVPVPQSSTSTTGAASTPCPTILQPKIIPAPQFKIPSSKGATGGAAPVNKSVKGLW